MGMGTRLYGILIFFKFLSLSFIEKSSLKNIIFRLKMGRLDFNF